MVRELAETFDPKADKEEQSREAARVVGETMALLENVLDALND